MRKALNPKVLENIKLEIYTFLKNKGVEDLDKISQNMEQFQALYVENLTETTKRARMQCRPAKKEIVVDEQFLIFDDNGSPIKWETNLAQLIHSQLGHEIIHAAAKHDKGSGLKTFNRNDKFSQNVGLNEGFTQLITEDIYNYNVSPNSDNYADFKKVAQILRLTFGENVILNSYFNQSNELENACNDLVGDNTFYSRLNRTLSDMYYLIPYKDSDSINLYNDMNKLTFQNLCVNIIVPHLQTLGKDEQTQYLTKILVSFKEQPLIGKQIIDTVKNALTMEDKEILSERKQISEQLTKMGVLSEERVSRPLENEQNTIASNISFEKLKEYLEMYELDYELDKNNEWEMFVKDRETGEKIDDIYIQKIVKFAEIWREAAGTKYVAGEKVMGETYAFNENSKEIFNQISQLINNNISQSGNIDTKAIIEAVSENEYKYSNEIISSLFSNQIKIKMLYDFYKLQNSQVKLETELPKTSVELLREQGERIPFNFDYNLEYINAEVEGIIGQININQKNMVNVTMEDSIKTISEETWQKRLKLVRKIISLYDISEADYQYERRVDDEQFNEDAVRKIVKPIEIDGKSIRVLPVGIKNLIADKTLYYDEEKGDNERHSEYTSRAIRNMINLLKAADNLTIDGGENFLLEFIQTPYVEYILGEMINGDTKLIGQLQERVEEAKRDNPGELCTHPKTKGELAKEAKILALEQSNSSNFKSRFQDDIKKAGIDVGDVYQMAETIEKDMQQDRGNGLDR